MDECDGINIIYIIENIFSIVFVISKIIKMSIINDLEKEWILISKKSDIDDLDNYQKFVEKFKKEHCEWKDLYPKYEKIMNCEIDKKDGSKNNNSIGELSIFLNEIQADILRQMANSDSNPQDIIDNWKVYKEVYCQLIQLLQKKATNIKIDTEA